jgi:MerR family transcriptional regulator, light-induced transcriptional regulator
MQETALARLRAGYIDALLAGDARGALALLEAANCDGATAEDLYLGVLAPAMHDIGDRWERGEIGVADEHFATAATNTALVQLAERLRRTGLGTGRVLVCGTPGERHRLGGRMIADFLHAAGWDVTHVPETATVEAIVDEVRDDGYELVALSTSLAWLLPEARRLCVALHALLRCPRVVVGGRAYRGDPRVAEMVGADAFATDPRTLIAELTREVAR